MELYLLIAVIILLVVNLIILLIQGKSKNDQSAAQMITEFERLKRDIDSSQSGLRRELNETTQSTVKSLGDILSDNQQRAGAMQSKKIEEVGKNTVERLDSIHSGISRQLNQMSTSTEERLKTFSLENEKKLENIRQAVDHRLTEIRQDNNQKLDEMRQIVDEKLQKTLEERMTQSFKLVNDRLEQVYKGLGEMQTLAAGVGDLKKVLSNVKTRGILGEIQLGAILEEILAPEQYDVNVVTKKGSKNPVEFAIKLPTEDDNHIYLPIDSKFPSDVYANLVDAYETGSKELIDEAVKQLKARIRGFAKDISEKYIDSPNTTDFAIMFLPFEGLYAEVVNRGMVEALQRDFKVNIAGPSTMAALLNSLQMGFKTFAIQKRSGEVWNVLGAVKTEFDKFGEVLVATQQRLEQANSELDKLVGVRTRQIQRKLKNITALNQQQTEAILPPVGDLSIEEMSDDMA